MHVTIPSAKWLKEPNGGSYYAYHVCIDGAPHADIRYSELHALNESLRRLCYAGLPDFPPKRIRRRLSDEQLAERRTGLQKFLQAVLQHPIASESPRVNSFLRRVQIDTFQPTTSNIVLEVYLCDAGRTPTIRCSVRDNTEHVLQAALTSMNVSRDLSHCFGLFIVRMHNDQSNFSYEKWLQNYESPYITLQSISQATGAFGMHRILLRKCYWEVSRDAEVFRDSGALRILFAQACFEANHGHYLLTKEDLQRLRVLQQDHSYLEYMRTCSIQASYGYLRLDHCTCTYPQPNTRVQVKVGRRSVVLAYTDPTTGEPAESVFRASRIRVWRIVTKFESDTYEAASDSQHAHSAAAPSMSFEFEYLMARDHFEWIALSTGQAPLMSLCLQSIGKEILSGKSSGSDGHSTASSPMGTVRDERRRHEEAPSASSSSRATGAAEAGGNDEQLQAGSTVRTTLAEVHCEPAPNGRRVEADHAPNGPHAVGSGPPARHEAKAENGHGHGAPAESNGAVASAGQHGGGGGAVSAPRYTSLNDVISGAFGIAKPWDRNAVRTESKNGVFDNITDDDL